jgi:glucose-6-phosphate isomerase
MKLVFGRYDEAVRKRAAALAPDVARIWRRDASFWGGDGRRQASVNNRLGWLDVAHSMRPNLSEIASFVDGVRADGIRDAVVLGMGGSSLAPEVLRQSIDGSGARLHVLDSTDPATILAVDRAVDPARTLFFVSSKSGTTIEANTLFEYFLRRLADAGVSDAGSHLVAITDEGTPLQRLAERDGFRHAFINPSDIGGRYSALSYFGLVPAAVAGIDITRLIERGVAEAEAAKAGESEAVLLGAALGELALHGRDKCTFLLSPGIASFGLWVEQLIAESTGKEGRGILPVDGEPILPADRYGEDRCFVYLRLASDQNADTDDAARTIEARGNPVMTIDLEDACDLGREFMRWEFAVAVAGHVLGINPFDEPNVQESKDNTNRVLREFEAAGKLDSLADSDFAVVDSSGAPSAVTSLWDDLTPGAYLAITAYIQQTPATDRAFADLRRTVAERFEVATTLGYGPRFLHSTGQLHKGGPPTGVFLQVTAADREDAEIPDRPFTFGQLKRAQAIGDFASLVAHGRPVVRLHLGSDIGAGLAGLLDAVREPAARSA